MRVVAKNTTQPRLRAYETVEANRRLLAAWGIDLGIYFGAVLWVVRSDDGTWTSPAISHEQLLQDYTEVEDEVATTAASLTEAKSAAVAKFIGLTLTQTEAEAVAGGVLTGTPGIVGLDGGRYRIGVDGSGTPTSEQMNP